MPKTFDISQHRSFERPHRPRFRLYSWWFPILQTGFSTAAFIAGYILAVKNDHSEAWFSLISDGGAILPERCIFGILLAFATFFWLLTAFSQHIRLGHHFEYYQVNGCGWQVIRWFMLICAIISGIGLMIVANFQEYTVGNVHQIGAWMAFFSGLVYVWMFLLVSMLIRPRFTPNWLIFVRGVLSLLATVALVVHLVAMAWAPFVKEDSNGKIPPRPTPAPGEIVRVKPDEPYFLNHLIAAISEWALAIVYQLVMLSFGYELSTLTITALNTAQMAETTENPELMNIKPVMLESRF